MRVIQECTISAPAVASPCCIRDRCAPRPRGIRTGDRAAAGGRRRPCRSDGRCPRRPRRARRSCCGRGGSRRTPGRYAASSPTGSRRPTDVRRLSAGWSVGLWSDRGGPRPSLGRRPARLSRLLTALWKTASCGSARAIGNGTVSDENIRAPSRGRGVRFHRQRRAAAENQKAGRQKVQRVRLHSKSRAPDRGTSGTR